VAVLAVTVGAANDMGQIKTFQDFQEQIWQDLPVRKHAIGKEAVFDCLAIIVQEWPDDTLIHTKSGDTGEVVATQELIKTVRRHLVLTYGEQKFGSLWLIALQILLPIIVDQVLRWWRRRRDNQGRLRVWRRKWVSDGGTT